MIRRALLIALAVAAAANEPPPVGSSHFRRSMAAGGGIDFDTGALRGTLHGGGQSIGLMPVTDAATTSAVARFKGLLSPYRLLTADRRFGEGAWDWPSTATVQPDGAVRVEWMADATHPLNMMGRYAWSSSNAIDLTLTITAREPLPKFEVFVASYFAGFPTASAWTREGMLDARKADGDWQMFPRDDAGAALIRDGRWKRPPHPVDWTIRPALAGALAIRRDATTGLTALIMAPPQDCFAVAMPYGEEGHRSIYLCLAGRDLAPGVPTTVRARLVIAAGLTDEAAISSYQAYVREAGR